MEFTESKQMLLEADRTGAVKIMVPVEELRSLLQVVEEQKKELAEKEVQLDQTMRYGQMLEGLIAGSGTKE